MSVSRKLLLVALLLLLVSDAAAQVGGASVLFKTIDPVPRSRALGEVGVVLQGTTGIADLNPASLTSRDQVKVHGGSSPWLPMLGAGIELSSFSAAYGRDRWALAYQIKHLDLGEHERRDASNEPLGTFHSYDISHELTGAYELASHLRAGVGLNYIFSDLAGGEMIEGQAASPGRALTVDLGLHYQWAWGNEDISIRPLAGWSLTDVGGKIEDVEDQEASLPTTMRGGLGVEVGFLRHWLHRPLLRVGHYRGAAKMIVARDENGKPYNSIGALFHTWKPIGVDLTPQTEGDEVRLSVWDQLMWSRGTEFSLLGILSFRRGHFEEHEYNGARNFDTSGWGFDLYFVAFDVAEIKGPGDDLLFKHPLASTRISTLTVRVPLGGEAEGNFWPELLDELGW